MYGSLENGDGLDIPMMEDIKQMVDKHNVLATSFRRVRDYIETN